MGFRLYLVPAVGDGTASNPRRAKYFVSDALGSGLIGIVDPGRYAALDYGFEPWMIVGTSLSSSDDATIVAESDGFALPFDLSPTLSAGQVANVQTKLEAVNIPADWLTTAFTWIQLVHLVLGMFTLLQRFAVIHGVTRIFGGAVTLDTTIGSLSASVRTDLIAAAQGLGVSTSGITGATTVRHALKLIADQMTDRSYYFNGVTV